jgi:hypothetical protein
MPMVRMRCARVHNPNYHDRNRADRTCVLIPNGIDICAFGRAISDSPPVNNAK